MVKGKGKYQTDKEETAMMSILKTLSEKKEQRYTNIKKASKSNDPTLQKYLKQFVELKMVEKRVDFESGKYPYPAYYSLTPTAKPIVEIMVLVEKEKEEIIRIISDPNKTPLDVLDQINTKNNNLILSFLKGYKKSKVQYQGLENFFLKLYVWYPYITLTSHLIEESKKRIEKIDVDDLLERNKYSIRMDKIGLKELGFPESKITHFLEKYANPVKTLGE